MPNTSLRAAALTLAYGDRTVVADLDLDVPPARVTAIVGANASGKSTLLKAMGRLLHPRQGAVLLDGAAIHRLPTREVARRVGLLAQAPPLPEGLTVEDLVTRGRYPRQRALQRWSAEDRERVAWALDATRMGDLRNRPLDELSGGQRQRAWIAMALAQDTEVLLLDEPTTFLDLAHQIEVLDLLLELNNRAGRTIVLVLHDLNQACRYADHLVALRDGAIHASGPPTEVVDAAMVEAVFGLRAQVLPDPVSGTPMCVPVGDRWMANRAATATHPPPGEPPHS